MRKIVCLISLLFFGVQLHATISPLPRLGQWRGMLTLNDSTELPFTIMIKLVDGKAALFIQNASEEIRAENFDAGDDSVNWRMPVFDSYFKCALKNDTFFSGTFYNNAASHPYKIPFHAEWGKTRFPYIFMKGPALFDGKWKCIFSPDSPDSSMAIGIFQTTGDGCSMTGTFLTETGDNRYLEGARTGPTSFELTCFDGSHAFVFKMHQTSFGKISGDAWYGNYGHEKWIGELNYNFQLRDPQKLTYVTDSSKVNFTFNDLNGKPVSLSDPQFKGKVVIIQIMGSWCPNCMDETKWLSDVYKQYHAQGLEIIALAYERSADTAIANANIRRLKNHFGADYTFLNTGKSGGKAASQSLPFINGVMCFPTTIYIGRDGKVKRIFTGFNGPATGLQFEKDADEALRFIQQLLGEKK